MLIAALEAEGREKMLGVWMLLEAEAEAEAERRCWGCGERTGCGCCWLQLLLLGGAKHCARATVATAGAAAGARGGCGNTCCW
jgi:hypothetical protein